MPSIQIIVSTFNGGEFLEPQLRSLLALKGADVHILVRDDGSSDGTRELLQLWQNQGLLEWYEGDNLGWAKSFMDALYHSGEYDYYAFCDQDDIWLQEKIEVAIDRLKGMPQGPKLYFSNITSWRDGKEEGLAKASNLHFDKYTSLVQCVATGNTMVFSKSLRDIICNGPRPAFLLAHDYWVFQVANLLGTVYYDSDSYILYRQHGDNQVGVKRTLLWDIKRKWGDIVKFSTDHRREDEAKSLLQCYGDLMDDETMEIVRTVAYYRRSFVYRWRLFVSRKYVMDTSLRTLLLKMRVLAGRV